MGALEALALHAVAGHRRSGARRDARPAGRGHDQPRPGREVLRGIRPHVQGAARAVERGQGAAAVPDSGVGARQVAIDAKAIESDNVIGILPGTDPALRDEYVVVSAHLDHVGVGEADRAATRIYNGAMDNASGIATLIETAAALAARGGLKRSVVFAAVTAEEKGLLGSRYFANHPTVPTANIVANLNTDMFLPLFPLKNLIVQGLEESDLARRPASAWPRRARIEVLSDPEPERNAFTRSDQYSFIKTGVPSLSLKVGFTKDSPEHEIVQASGAPSGITRRATIWRSRSIARRRRISGRCTSRWLRPWRVARRGPRGTATAFSGASRGDDSIPQMRGSSADYADYADFLFDLA